MNSINNSFVEAFAAFGILKGPSLDSAIRINNRSSSKFATSSKKDADMEIPQSEKLGCLWPCYREA